ncbi:hypothetical protein [Sporosarcina globispora]|uniref:hypothetical protein n=1 Tax=Sporosarcina globispora TaxID=1459 RepID=UPI00128EC614|nr:hypothetical protein [Sporosarcina globispora]
MDPGENPDIESLVLPLENAMLDLTFAADNYPLAVQNNDSELLNQCSDALINSEFFFGSAKGSAMELFKKNLDEQE